MSRQFLVPHSSPKAFLRKICLNINPNTAFVDEIISITVTGLRPVQRVTVQAVLKQGEAEFLSNAHFLADNKGHVDVSEHVSLGGTYTGVEKMGLFWSLRPVPGESMRTRIMKTDVTRPLDFTVSVIDDQIPFDDLQLNTIVMRATGGLERWYKHPTVRRIVVREGPLRGILFLPPEEGPFPGVIDMTGSVGGLVEYRAALLASRGFACFALSLFKYDDLPSTIADIDLDYMLGAVDWLASNPWVHGGGIGVVGTSKGAEFALLLGMTTNKVKAVVNISGLPFYTLDDLKKSGQVFWKGTGWDFNKMKYTDEGVTSRDCPCYGAEVIPAWKNNAHILYIHGEDDAVWRSDEAKRFIEACPEEKKKNIELLSFPGAGHRIEPPYMPMYRTLYHPMIDMNLLMGGHPESQAAAEEDAWKRILHFLHKHLPH